MASAAYWVGSAASRIVVESAAQVGSIGVLMVHNDFSAMDQRIGIKTTYLTAGYYKAMGNDAEPLTDEAKAYFQQQLDHIYGLFSSAVARNRGASEKKVKTDMADGRLFIGSQAVDAGLADEIGSMSTAVNYLMEESRMKTVAEVKEKCPDLVAQIEEEAKKAGMIEARQETETAIKGATDRLLALVDVHFGTEGGKAFRAIVASGATAEMYAAIKAVQPANHDAEAEAKAKMLAAIQAAGPPAVGSDVPPAGGEKPFETLVAEHMAANPGEKKSAAMQAVQKANPAAYETWLAGKQKK
jgi:ClpP class serine protease